MAGDLATWGEGRHIPMFHCIKDVVLTFDSLVSSYYRPMLVYRPRLVVLVIRERSVPTRCGCYSQLSIVLEGGNVGLNPEREGA